MDQVLLAQHVRNETTWDWVLKDGPDGATLAAHQVRLDEHEREYAAFRDPYGFLRCGERPADWLCHEQTVVESLGDWIGRRVLGEHLADQLHGTVRVEIPAEGRFIATRPLELARVRGDPLAHRLVTFAYQWPSARPRLEKQRVDGRARVLALFPMPAVDSPLSLRRERRELERAVREARKPRQAIDLHVLQYGVTRERLHGVIEQDPHWDVLHVASRGAHPVLPLERADGSPDPLPLAELVPMLKPIRHRLKLVLLWPHRSGSRAAAHTLRALAMEDEAAGLETCEEVPSASVESVTELACRLVEDLDVGVLAMRYPTADDFTVDLTGQFYQSFLGSRNSADRALAYTLQRATDDRSMHRPPLSIGAPALFGDVSADRAVRPPERTSGGRPSDRMGAFPAEPPQLVGHARCLVAASAALAPESGRNAVLLVGPAGAGTTACALELARQHRGRFAPVWWRAAPAYHPLSDALHDVTETWHRQLADDVPMMRTVRTSDELHEFLPHLTAALQENAILLVLDGLHAVLHPGGAWMDPAFGELVDGIVEAGGESRILITSRVTPQGIDENTVHVERVDLLSRAESVLLLRELGPLRTLLHDGRSAAPDDRIAADRDLARRILDIAGGLPKLLMAAAELLASVDVQPRQPFGFRPRRPTILLDEISKMSDLCPELVQLTRVIGWHGTERAMDDTEITTRISELTDQEAVAALAYVLDEEEPSASRRAQLEQEAEELPKLTEGVAAPRDADGDKARPGDVARATLRYLATVDEARPDVIRAIELPAAVLHRDPLLLGIVGGLAFLALSRFGFKMTKDEQGRRSYTVEYRPVPDEAMTDLLQLLTKFIPGP